MARVEKLKANELPRNNQSGNSLFVWYEITRAYGLKVSRFWLRPIATFLWSVANIQDYWPGARVPDDFLVNAFSKYAAIRGREIGCDYAEG